MRGEDLAKALEAFPDLKKQVEELLLVASNPNSRIELADDAEERILEVSRQLNRAALQAWAENQAAERALDFSKRHAGSRKDVKKN